MTTIDILGQTVAGLRLALVLFAVMSLIAIQPAHERSPLEWYRARTWTLLALAIIAYSPAHAAEALHRPFPPIVNRTLDAVSTTLACACLINLLAARGLMRGLSERRVSRGIAVNLVVLACVVGSAWLTR